MHMYMWHAVSQPILRVAPGVDLAREGKSSAFVETPKQQMTNCSRMGLARRLREALSIMAVVPFDILIEGRFPITPFCPVRRKASRGLPLTSTFALKRFPVTFLDVVVQ